MTSDIGDFVLGETTAALLERLASYLPARCNLETPKYQEWVQRQIRKHREEAALLAMAPSLNPQQAAKLRILQTERQDYTANMAARKGAACQPFAAQANARIPSEAAARGSCRGSRQTAGDRTIRWTMQLGGCWPRGLGADLSLLSIVLYRVNVLSLSLLVCLSTSDLRRCPACSHLSASHLCTGFESRSLICRYLSVSPSQATPTHATHTPLHVPLGVVDRCLDGAVRWHAYICVSLRPDNPTMLYLSSDRWSMHRACNFIDSTSRTENSLELSIVEFFVKNSRS